MGGELRQWEYRVVADPGEAGLNALGAEGWELTGVAGDRLFLKRPAPDFRERMTLEQRRRYVAGQVPGPAAKGHDGDGADG